MGRMDGNSLGTNTSLFFHASFQLVSGMPVASGMCLRDFVENTPPGKSNERAIKIAKSFSCWLAVDSADLNGTPIQLQVFSTIESPIGLIVDKSESFSKVVLTCVSERNISHTSQNQQSSEVECSTM